MATKTVIILIDVACILWIIAVINDPWTMLLNVIGTIFKVIVGILFVIPIGLTVIITMNGGTTTIGDILFMYTMEAMILGLFIGGLCSLQGIWSIIKSTAALFQLMISVPATFVLCSIAYLTW